MKVLRDCPVHNSKESSWCSHCQTQQIEDCKECHGKRIERISEILSSKGHTRTEYLNAMKAVMKEIYCPECIEASGFDPDKLAWPYEEPELETFEKTLSKQ